VKLVRDPVCGTWIDPGASLAIDTRGTTHYFCSAACRDDFKRTA
jgi:YHS domain-containing protein